VSKSPEQLESYLRAFSSSQMSEAADWIASASKRIANLESVIAVCVEAEKISEQSHVNVSAAIKVYARRRKALGLPPLGSPGVPRAE